METKELFEKVLATFDNNDSDGLLALVTEDFEWDMVGDQVVKGKKELEKMFSETDTPAKMIGTTKELQIIDNHKAACKGIVTMESKDGKVSEQYYCDLYEFEGGKLKKMTTFTAPVKKSNSKSKS